MLPRSKICEHCHKTTLAHCLHTLMYPVNQTIHLEQGPAKVQSDDAKYNTRSNITGRRHVD